MHPRHGTHQVGVRDNETMGLVDAAFGHPRGLAGRLGAALMLRANAEQERRALAAAQLKPG